MRDPDHPTTLPASKGSPRLLRTRSRTRSGTYPELDTTLTSVTMARSSFSIKPLRGRRRSVRHEKIRILREPRPPRSEVSRRSRCRREMSRRRGDDASSDGSHRRGRGCGSVNRSINGSSTHALAGRRRRPDRVGPAFSEAWFAAELDLASVETRSRPQVRSDLVPPPSPGARRGAGAGTTRQRAARRPLASRPLGLRTCCATIARARRSRCIGAPPSSSNRLHARILRISAVQESLADYLLWLAVVGRPREPRREATRDFRRAIAIFEKRMRARPLDPDFDVLCRRVTTSWVACWSTPAIPQSRSTCTAAPSRCARSCVATTRVTSAGTVIARVPGIGWARHWRTWGESPKRSMPIRDSWPTSAAVYADEPGDIKRGKSLDERLRQLFRLQRGPRATGRGSRAGP